MGAEHPIMQENLPVERLVPKTRSAEEPNGRPGTRQLGIHRIFFPDNLKKAIII
jgi:hypothetical protein